MAKKSSKQKSLLNRNLIYLLVAAAGLFFGAWTVEAFQSGTGPLVGFYGKDIPRINEVGNPAPNQDEGDGPPIAPGARGIGCPTSSGNDFVAEGNWANLGDGTYVKCGKRQSPGEPGVYDYWYDNSRHLTQEEVEALNEPIVLSWDDVQETKTQNCYTNVGGGSWLQSGAGTPGTNGSACDGKSGKYLNAQELEQKEAPLKTVILTDGSRIELKKKEVTRSAADGKGKPDASDPNDSGWETILRPTNFEQNGGQGTPLTNTIEAAAQVIGGGAQLFTGVSGTGFQLAGIGGTTMLTPILLPPTIGAKVGNVIYKGVKESTDWAIEVSKKLEVKAPSTLLAVNRAAEIGENVTEAEGKVIDRVWNAPADTGNFIGTNVSNAGSAFNRAVQSVTSAVTSLFKPKEEKEKTAAPKSNSGASTGASAGSSNSSGNSSGTSSTVNNAPSTRQIIRGTAGVRRR